MSVVLDASAALAWCFEDERTPPIVSLLRDVEASGALVPIHWSIEVANALLVAERRGRLQADAVDGLTVLIASLPITVDADAARMSALPVPLARREALTVYDAAYVELARRTGLPLATLDQPMARAARHLGIDLVLGP